MNKFALGMLGLMLMLSGCETLMPPRPGDSPGYAPTFPANPDVHQVTRVNGGIYSSETAIPLFETPRARHAGDIITVKLIEKTNAKKQATTRQTKNDKTQIVNATVLGRPISFGGGYNFDFDLDAKRQFNGEGQSVQNNQLDGSISVTVAEVLANGNMVVQGEKWIRINQGNEFIRLTGIIRPQDIRPDNTITSDRLANARIAYGGTGQVNNTNAQGWVNRIIWGPIFPV